MPPAKPAPDAERLRAHVRALEGERHPRSSPEALARAEGYVADGLAGAGWPTERFPFRFRGREHANLVARREGSRPDRPRVLVGAHVDSVAGSPGADDNASGCAVLLEVARLLAPLSFEATVELVAFALEEQQIYTYRVGSRRYARAMREEGVEYAGALVLEMVGYTDDAPGSQRVPALLFWKDVPETGDFLAAAGSWGSRRLLRRFREAVGEAAPSLRLVTARIPFRGWLVPDTRMSDNASFWDEGYPSLMVTDTAYLRNPNYHRATDTIDTLDFGFMARVAGSVARAVRELAGVVGGGE